MKKYLEIFIRSIYGGAAVSFGGLIYLSCENKYIGSLLFVLGLFIICEFDFSLFTGKIGYLLFKPKDYIFNLLCTLIGNFAGCFAVAKIALYAKPSLVSVTAQICDVKHSETFLQNLLLSFMCGIMMFIAVEVYKTKAAPAKYIGMFMAVPIFILCGFEHSIANMFYFTLGNVPALQFISFSAVTVLGNSLGSIVFSLFKFYNKNTQKT